MHNLIVDNYLKNKKRLVEAMTKRFTARYEIVPSCRRLVGRT